MTDATKTLAQRFFIEFWNRGNPAVADQICADNYVAHVASVPEAIQGIERFKQFVALFHVLLPDLNFEIEDQIAEGDKVVTRWTARGIASGAPGDTMSTTEQITFTGISIHRVADGKLVESWDNWDALTTLQALGSDVFESISLSL